MISNSQQVSVNMAGHKGRSLCRPADLLLNSLSTTAVSLTKLGSEIVKDWGHQDMNLDDGEDR